MTLTLNKGFWLPAGGGASEASVEAQGTLSTGYSGTMDKNFVVGGNWHPSSSYQPHGCFNGQIDSARISDINRYTSATSAGDTISIPSSEFTTDSDTIYLMNFNAASLANPDEPSSISADSSYYSNTNNRDTTNTMFSSAAAWTGGTSKAALEYGSPSALNDLFNLAYNDAWTFECFVRPTALLSVDGFNIGMALTNYVSYPQFQLGLLHSSGALYAYCTWWHSGSGYVALTGSTNISGGLNAWYYLAMTNTAAGNFCLIMGAV